MSSDAAPDALDQIMVRSFDPKDQTAVSRLYHDGLLVGQIAPNDTGADVENIREAYFSDDSSHFWVAELDGEVLGMIGVARDEGHTAEIRRLRVHPEYQTSPTIASLLVEQALQHCKHYEYLKVVLDTGFEKEAAVDLFDRFGFQHTRTRNYHGKDQFEFYLDLYRQPKSENREQ